MEEKTRSPFRLEEVEGFGLTNNVTALSGAIQYIEDAVDDGWNSEPTYTHEGISSAATLTREGFKIMVLARTLTESRFRYQANVSIWGPDGLGIRPPELYNFEHIKEGLRVCNECGEADVDTFRYSFAGRACKDCLPAMKKNFEGRGWDR